MVLKYRKLTEKKNLKLHVHSCFRVLTLLFSYNFIVLIIVESLYEHKERRECI